MPCGRKHYQKLKDRKSYKDIILLLKANDGTYWTYDEDAAELKSVLYGNCVEDSSVSLSLQISKDELSRKFILRHLVGDAYKAVPRDDEGKSSIGQNEESEPIPVYRPVPPIERSCENCFHRISGDCTLVRPRLCEEYRASPPATREEKEGRRIMGDASGIAQGIPWYRR